MQTSLKPDILQKDALAHADKILRNCVHCGFCTAVCPTYKILGNELDSPRGRIYLIKQILEGEAVKTKVARHLDRCLMCRSCESICPSGVEYFRLLDLGKSVVREKLESGPKTKAKKYLIRKFLTSGWYFNSAIKLAAWLKPILPARVKNPLPGPGAKAIRPKSMSQAQDRVLLLPGCVQPALAPNINNATIALLQELRIAVELDADNSCCGAIDHHLQAKHEAHGRIKTNIDRWHTKLNSGISFIISNISGCGATIKDYPEIMRGDAEYTQKAKFIAERTLDIAEYVKDKDLSRFKIKTPGKIAYHPPCTMQHWQGITGLVEKILEDAGFTLAKINNEHICCGSAGTYSFFEPELSHALQQQKIVDLLKDKPSIIVSSNIGCISHLAGTSKVPVKHWVELFTGQIGR